MLRAGAEASHKQRRRKQADAAAETGEAIADAGKRGAEREHQRRTEAFGQKAGGNLKTGHRAGEHGLHQPERGKAEAEFLLPDRQHHVDQIGITVVQRVGAAGDAERAPLLGFAMRGRLRIGVAGGNRHCLPGLRSTKMVLTNESTVSPFWLTPPARVVISPKPGRLLETRVSITSLEYSIVSPT